MSIAQFVEASQSVSSIDDLERMLTAEVRALGFDYIVYCQFSRYQASGDPAALVPVSTLPDMWVTHYVRNGYSDIDPVIHRARHTARPFLWREVWAGDLLRNQQTLREESAMVGLRHGVTVPLFGPAGYAALLSVSGQTAEAERPATARAIGALAAQFQLMYQELSEDGADDPVPAFVPLTPREREVLLWAARGKSNWDIGQILGVSESAVNFHITNAMRKLDASGRVMAVLKAIRHGLIIP